ncbi:MAG: hypothetical protein ACI957_002362 [Verrucomicrobiales bacterium]|jgi:hypothetical protein
MNEPDPQRTLQPWQTSQVNSSLTPSSGHSSVAVGGILTVLILAIVTKAVETQSSGMAVTAAFRGLSGGFPGAFRGLSGGFPGAFRGLSGGFPGAF